VPFYLSVAPANTSGAYLLFAQEDVSKLPQPLVRIEIRLSCKIRVSRIGMMSMKKGRKAQVNFIKRRYRIEHIANIWHA
jgi:hypothetical protein